MTPDELARACADAMWAEDNASRGLGMTLDHVAPGQSRMSMLVTEAMVNGIGLCHGGFIFALADSAMAFASNAYGDHAVAQHVAVTYVRPGRAGETLTAEAVEHPHRPHRHLRCSRDRPRRHRGGGNARPHPPVRRQILRGGVDAGV